MNKKLNIILISILAIMLLVSCVNKTADTTATATPTPVLNNKIFKINMPNRFDGLYDTEVDDKSINFYDKECKSEGYSGWAFGIAAYENPNDWAGGPIEKVGELSLNDNKLYDIVIIYPTESQYGFDRDMPEKFKNLYDARFEIAKTVESNDGNKISVGAGNAGENIYKDVIKKHITAIEEKWDSDKLDSEHMSELYSMMDDSGNLLDSVGYFYKDINVDGIDELLIGEISDDAHDGLVYDIYTMVDRKPTHVVSGGERDRYYILQNGFVLNEYSNSATNSGSDVYNLQTNSTELFLQFAFKYDEDADSKNPWFVSYDSSNSDNRKWDSVSNDEWNKMQDRVKDRLDIQYTALSK